MSRSRIARFVRAAALPLTLAFPLHAAPLERDLGQGLRYLRAAALPADLSAPAKPGPLVLDLRFAPASETAAESLQAWLRSHTSPAAPALVLLNRETAPALRNLFPALKSLPGLLTIGPASPDFTPDIVLAVDPVTERRAYDALQQGASVDSLLNEHAGKPRFDEASLTQNPAASSTDEEFPELRDDTPPAEKTAPPPPPLVDRALQRAVHLHRALLALKRL